MKGENNRLEGKKEDIVSSIVSLYLNGAALDQSCVVWAAQQIVRRSGNFNVFHTARVALQNHL